MSLPPDEPAPCVDGRVARLEPDPFAPGNVASRPDELVLASTCAVNSPTGCMDAMYSGGTYDDCCLSVLWPTYATKQLFFVVREKQAKNVF